MKSPITTHVLDTSQGRPAAGVPAVLEVREASEAWRELARGTTDDDGRISDLLAPDHALAPGIYRLTSTWRPTFGRRARRRFIPASRSFSRSAPPASITTCRCC